MSVVTGASGGIGRHIALGLAREGHIVVLLVRDRQRGEAARGWILGQVKRAQLVLQVADLSLLAEAKRAAAQIVTRHGRVDVLVNNAGMFATRRRLTAEGHEQVLAVNHLAPFVLTRGLLPAVRAAAAVNDGARIVNVGSSTSDRASIDPADLEGARRWGMVRSYSQSKLALMIASFGWARRLEGTGVVANVVHPGMVATGLIRAGGPIGLAWRLMAPHLLTEAQGADTPLFVALAPEFAAVSGSYVKKRQAVAPNRLAQDPALAARVWEATERLAGP